MLLRQYCWSTRTQYTAVHGTKIKNRNVGSGWRKGVFHNNFGVTVPELLILLQNLSLAFLLLRRRPVPHSPLPNALLVQMEGPTIRRFLTVSTARHQITINTSGSGGAKLHIPTASLPITSPLSPIQ